MRFQANTEPSKTIEKSRLLMLRDREPIYVHIQQIIMDAYPHLKKQGKLQNQYRVLTTTSGRTFSQSQARILPERAKPLCISSAIIKILYFEHRSLTACR